MRSFSGSGYLIVARDTQRVSLEFDREAFAGRVIEIEQEIPDGAALDVSHQLRDGGGIGRIDRGDLGSVEIALADEFAGARFGGEREHRGPRRAGGLERDQSTVAIEQKMQFATRTQASSIRIVPAAIAAARSRTSAG